ncbi:hypothetical protein ACFQXA_22785 [Nocardiopsis composta]
MAPYKDGLVVASHVRSTYGSEKTEGKGGLRLHVCDEPTCADPRTIEPPGEIAAGAFLDIAVSPEGASPSLPSTPPTVLSRTSPAPTPNALSRR